MNKDPTALSAWIDRLGSPTFWVHAGLLSAAVALLYTIAAPRIPARPRVVNRTRNLYVRSVRRPWSRAWFDPLLMAAATVGAALAAFRTPMDRWAHVAGAAIGLGTFLVFDFVRFFQTDLMSFPRWTPTQKTILPLLIAGVAVALTTWLVRDGAFLGVAPLEWFFRSVFFVLVWAMRLWTELHVLKRIHIHHADVLWFSILLATNRPSASFVLGAFLGSVAHTLGIYGAASFAYRFEQYGIIAADGTFVPVEEPYIARVGA